MCHLYRSIFLFPFLYLISSLLLITLCFPPPAWISQAICSRGCLCIHICFHLICNLWRSINLNIINSVNKLQICRNLTIHEKLPFLPYWRYRHSARNLKLKLHFSTRTSAKHFEISMQGYFFLEFLETFTFSRHFGTPFVSGFSRKPLGNERAVTWINEIWRYKKISVEF